MATATVPPGRWPMSLLNGGIAGTLVAVATGTAGASTSGDHSVTLALIALFGGLLTALVTAVVGPLLVSRWRGPAPSDLTNRLVDQLEERNSEIARLHAEIAELRGDGK